MISFLRFFILTMLMAGLASPVWADQEETAFEKLKHIEQELNTSTKKKSRLLQEKEETSRDLESLRQNMVTTAKRAQEYEKDLSEIESRLQQLEQKEHAEITALQENNKDIGALLAAMIRLSRQPPQAMLVLPYSPLDVGHSSIVMRDAVPMLQGRAEKMQEDLTIIASLRQEISIEYTALTEKKTDLVAERENLEQMVQQRSQAQRHLHSQETETAQRVADLAAKADNLRDLLNKLAEERAKKLAKITPKRRPGGQEPPSVTAARGNLALPAEGVVVANFGQDAPVGGKSRGIYIKTRDEAQVVSPYDGEVVYAGPFRSYGLVLIIDHGQGYHSLLAGLGRIDCVVGQGLLSGEPIGLMDQASGHLYVEFRRHGQPINPSSWLALGANKVRG